MNTSQKYSTCTVHVYNYNYVCLCVCVCVRVSRGRGWLTLKNLSTLPLTTVYLPRFTNETPFPMYLMYTNLVVVDISMTSVIRTGEKNINYSTN